VIDVPTSPPRLDGDAPALRLHETSRMSPPEPRSMELPSKEILLDAAERARLRYPGPVGELLHQELVSWLQFGHFLGSTLIFRVAEELIADPAARDRSPTSQRSTRRAGAPAAGASRAADTPRPR